MSKILHRRTADGRVRRLLQPTPTDGVILRRRTADGRVRRILRSAAASEVAVSAVGPAAFESLARQAGDDTVPLEGLALEGNSIALLVEWLEQGNKVVADQSLSIEWSALPVPMRVSLERLLASPGKRRLLGTPGRLRLLKRP
jgi:hypothetical protein